MLKGGLNGGQQAPNGVHITEQVYGATVPLAYGLVSLKPKLIWLNDWRKHDDPVNKKLQSVLGTSSGKKSGGKKSGTKYYSAAVDFVLGHAPIVAALSVYYNNTKFACPIIKATGTVSGGSMSFVPGPVYQASSLFDIFTGPTGGTGIVAGIVSATVEETYSETFDDYGGDGARTVSGTWEHPLWNSAFARPGDIDPATAFTPADGYYFSWDGLNPTVTVPSALNGKTLNVYYGTPQILTSHGALYNTSITPLHLLNLEFEFAQGSGSEYTKYPAQQIINHFCSGLGSALFDLGAQNSIPNLLVESIGAFALWPNGDCDIVDIITDIATSGPILLGAN